MPPAPSQKGTGKKASGIARQRSRNTTPSAGPPPGAASAGIPPVEYIDTEYVELRLEYIADLTVESFTGSDASNAVIPDSKSLDGMITRLGKLSDITEKQGQLFDRGMRLLAPIIKMHSADAANNEEKPHKEDAAKKANKKKRKANDSLAPRETNTGKCIPGGLVIKCAHGSWSFFFGFEHCPVTSFSCSSTLNFEVLFGCPIATIP